MGLTTNKEEQLKKMPRIETKIAKSKSGKFLVHQTIITHIRPMAYYQAIIDNAQELAVEDIDESEEA